MRSRVSVSSAFSAEVLKVEKSADWRPCGGGVYGIRIRVVADLTKEEIQEIEEKGAEGAKLFKAKEWMDEARSRIVSVDMVRLPFAVARPLRRRP